MANPSVLTPIGFDTPQLQFAVTPQVAQNIAPDSTPDTTGLNILSEANKSFQQTQQAQVESSRQQADALNNIQKAQMSATQAMAQADATLFQSNAASGQQNIRAWTGLVENIGGQIEKVTKIAEAKRLAELKAQLDQNQITSTTELENLQLDWIEGGKIAKEGTAAYRREVGKILASRPLQADTISGLTTKYFQPGLDHAKQQDKLIFDTAQKVAGNNADIISQKFRIDLITETAGLQNQAYSSPEQTQTHLESINAKIAAIYARTDIDDLTKTQVVSDALDPVLKASNIGVQAKTELGLHQLGASTLANYINTNSARVVSGDLSQTQFDDDANTIRRNYKMTEKETTNPQKDMDRVMTNMQNSLTLEDLRMKGVINSAKAVEGNRLYVAGLAAQFYLDPIMLGRQNENDPTLDTNAKTAIKFAKEGIIFFRDDRREFEAYQANANKVILQIQKGDYVAAMALINKSGEDNTTNSLAASLRNLGLGMPNQAPGRVGVTQEQLDQTAAASEQIQKAIIAEVAVRSDAYRRRAKEFADVGIFQNKVDSQTFLKGMQPQLKAYNDEIAAIKMKSVRQLQVPGQSANFNGGSLGAQVPLTKRSFRGVQGVVMPFPVGAANSMADAGGKDSGGYFGDARTATRDHAGVDFPVPTGTPILSVVYGTVSEVQRSPGAGKHYGNAVAVKGDDGKEYFFAHMDKSSVALGQRVGPGEKLGYSGESGAPGAPHLHMEISVGGKPMDPLQVLSTGNFGQQPKGLRTAGSPNLGAENQVQIDPRAIPMGNNSYMIDGKMVKFNPDFSKSQALGTGGASGPGVAIKDMVVIGLSTDIQDIKIKAGLEPVGYTALPITKASPPGTPVGYYTLRNKAGGLLIQTAFLKKGATKMVNSFGIDGKTYVAPRELVYSAPGPRTAATPSGGSYASASAAPSGGNDFVSMFGNTHGDKARRNVPIIMREFKKAGYPDEIIAAALINVIAESNFDEKIPGDGGNAIGLFQLNTGGAGAGMSVAHREDPANNTRGILADYGMAIVKRAYDAGERDIPTLAALFSKEVERPRDEAGAMATRRKIAKEYFPTGRLGGGGGNNIQRNQSTAEMQGGARPQPAPASDDRIPMGNGKYMLRGKVIGSAADYTNSSPLQPSYASASKNDYGVGDDTTYNYAQLQREPKLLAALETEAKRAGVPTQWLADLAALSGTSGIQGPEELAQLADKLQGSTIRTPQDMVVAALGDKEAVLQLGIHAGRRYDSQFSRFARATAGVHREQTADCTLCSRLASQTDFIVHKGELA